MLNRVINGHKKPDERMRLIEVMRKVQANPATDTSTRKVAADFLEALGEVK